MKSMLKKVVVEVTNRTANEFTDVIGFVDKESDFLAITPRLEAPTEFVITHRATGRYATHGHHFSFEQAVTLKRMLEPLVDWTLCRRDPNSGTLGVRVELSPSDQEKIHDTVEGFVDDLCKAAQ